MVRLLKIFILKMSSVFTKMFYAVSSSVSPACSRRCLARACDSCISRALLNPFTYSFAASSLCMLLSATNLKNGTLPYVSNIQVTICAFFHALKTST